MDNWSGLVRSRSVTPASPKSSSRRPHPIVRFLLDESLLGFLAIVAAALTLIPVLFKVSHETESGLEAGQWAIILLFATEYALSLAKARSKRQFLLDPWRMIDAGTILIPLISFIPGTSDWLRSTPVLRLVRLARLLTLGVRAGGAMVRQERAAATIQKQGEVQVRKILPGTPAPAHPQPATWEEFVGWARNPVAGGYSIGNVSQGQLSEFARAANVSGELISSRLFGLSYPDVETAGNFLSLYVQMPGGTVGRPVERQGLLVLANATCVITFSRRSTDPIEKLPTIVPKPLADLSLPVRLICQVLLLVLNSNESLVAEFEQQLAALEDLPVRESRPQFFERTFRLKKELSAAQSDLWRLRGVLRELAEGRVKFPGSDGLELPFLRELSETADYLYETVNNIREGVLSLIDLHLNVVSFEMNRVMRVLAVVSVLGLIPAVVGGLFGMNLADNPWSFTLPQVSFAVSLGMITCLYFFVVKGWLR